MNQLTEEQKKFLDTGKYLTLNSTLSSKYSKIAGVNVKVYIDRAHGFPVVYYGGKRIMELVSGNNSKEQQRVREHFRRIRNKTNDYNEVWDKLKENHRDRDRRFQEAKKDLVDTHVDAHLYYMGYGKRSVVLNGGKNV